MKNPWDKKYKPEFADNLPEMFKQGESVAEVCAELKVARSTFYLWLKEYPDFGDAYKIGQVLSESWWAKLGRAGACGKADINPAVWIFNMKAKFNYTEKTDINMSLSGNLNVAIDPVEEMKKRGIPIPNIDLEDIK